MHKSCLDLAKSFELPEATWRAEDWGGMHVSFETYNQAWDATPFLQGLPDDQCQCPHWGYVTRGGFRAIYRDREEEIRAGQAYYLPAGHSIVMEAGTELIEFSPREEFDAHMRAVEENLDNLGGHA